ncbi:hypothetical protein ROZALSC1DRAFT_28788 [Rozella allomycis CSF55]|uniref:GOLD domain-containing protein n=1 Tax=Rozella allomycis (strain CSF55) TaxID=988480 RepID=A0A075AXX1_ROZAC|nr:hypothetical protein O9G_003629 [Rozella allomycis CSF55]RKP19634.1 hypothetical protein ROZALSC1DRAFT_28788 [Rozella allomycis CSF55]|eukprot:EPZ35140.1 hypothetical protein O9G_003629 [Rozella allomycis CSF55]
MTGLLNIPYFILLLFLCIPSASSKIALQYNQNFVQKKPSSVIQVHVKKALHPKTNFSAPSRLNTGNVTELRDTKEEFRSNDYRRWNVLAGTMISITLIILSFLGIKYLKMKRELNA